MNGFVNLLKPPGMTSHDVVQQVRRVLRTRSVGHTGTLDPAAAGVLVLTVGDATRLGEYLVEGDKGYRAEVTLGLTTDSADADGAIVGETSAAAVTLEALQASLEQLTGTITMRPPAHSAIRVEGRRLYELARAGEQVLAPERTVVISELRLLGFAPGELAQVRLEVTCSKGTYIRALATMLGEQLGCGGYLSALLRTRVGTHRIEDSRTLEELAANPGVCLLTAREALPHLPEVTVDAAQAEALRHGQAIAGDQALSPGPVLVYDTGGGLLCLAEARSAGPTLLQPRKVFSNP
jgi:tRNA pseudouridine55 synthase